jgi:hypothetical protein
MKPTKDTPPETIPKKMESIQFGVDIGHSVRSIITIIEQQIPNRIEKIKSPFLFIIFSYQIGLTEK